MNADLTPLLAALGFSCSRKQRHGKEGYWLERDDTVIFCETAPDVSVELAQLVANRVEQLEVEVAHLTIERDGFKDLWVRDRFTATKPVTVLMEKTNGY